MCSRSDAGLRPVRQILAPHHVPASFYRTRPDQSRRGCWGGCRRVLRRRRRCRGRRWSRTRARERERERKEIHGAARAGPRRTARARPRWTADQAKVRRLDSPLFVMCAHRLADHPVLQKTVDPDDRAAAKTRTPRDGEPDRQIRHPSPVMTTTSSSRTSKSSSGCVRRRAIRSATSNYPARATVST